jgi:hypothetical protein
MVSLGIADGKKQELEMLIWLLFMYFWTDHSRAPWLHYETKRYSSVRVNSVGMNSVRGNSKLRGPAIRTEISHATPTLGPRAFVPVRPLMLYA